MIQVDIPTDIDELDIGQCVESTDDPFTAKITVYAYLTRSPQSPTLFAKKAESGGHQYDFCSSPVCSS